MESTLDLQVLTPVDWPLLKAARLDALKKDSPHAFMSRYELEWTWDESEWRRSIEATTWIVAREAERVVSLARSVVEPRQPWARFLESIWVDPAGDETACFGPFCTNWRRWSDTWVSQSCCCGCWRTTTARHAYEAAGFTPTGKRQFLPEIARFEVQLKLPIRRSPSV